MLLSTLNIFPPNALSDSVITTVWASLFVIAFFNLRFGWSLSGLVIPGYLIPLLILKPGIVVTIILSGIITYYAAYFLSETLSSFGVWHSFFGRDRFFLIIVLSVILLSYMNEHFLPAIGDTLNNIFQLDVDYRDNFYIFGLIIVALVANSFWKTGVVRGLPPLLITLVISYILVRYVLMEFTNFSISSLAYTYSDFASHINYSPKIYIIILITAYLASLFNLYYAWEYNGIMIPSLIAIFAYNPNKIFVTLAETLLIYLIASSLLKLPFFQKINMEGARKILFFFNISFLYKIIAGFAIISFLPKTNITDFYGAAYLITTVLAIKMHEKKIPLRMTLHIVLIVTLSTIMSVVAGYGLTKTETNMSNVLSPQKNPDPSPSMNLSALEYIQKQSINWYQFKLNNNNSFSENKKSSLRRGISQILDFCKTNDKKLFESAQSHLALAGYSFTSINPHFYYIGASDPTVNLGSYLINTTAATPLTIELVNPIEDPNLVPAVMTLAKRLDAKIIVFNRIENNDAIDSEWLHELHKILSRYSVLQIKLSGKSHLKNQLWLAPSYPKGLDINTINQLVGHVHYHWGSHHHLSTLKLSQKTIEHLGVASGTHDSFNEIAHVSSLQGDILTKLLANKNELSQPGSNQYEEPTVSELVFLDKTVITPILELIEHFNTTYQLDRKKLFEISKMAGLLNYSITLYNDLQHNQGYILLDENNLSRKKHWGTYIFKMGKSSPYLLQAANTTYELDSLQTATVLYRKLHAFALMLPGAHFASNLSGSANLMAQGNWQSLYSLVNQAILRDAKREYLPIQIKEFDYSIQQDIPESDALIAFRSGIWKREQFKSIHLQLIKNLEEIGYYTTIVNGTDATAGYEVSNSPQEGYLSQSHYKNDFSVLWISPALRSLSGEKANNAQQLQQFTALNVEQREANLLEYIQTTGISSSDLLPNELIDSINKYIQNADIVQLSNILQSRPYEFTRIVDHNSHNAFLIVTQSGKILGITKLHRTKDVTTAYYRQSDLTQQKIMDFIDSDQQWILFRDKEA